MTLGAQAHGFGRGKRLARSQMKKGRLPFLVTAGAAQVSVLDLEASVKLFKITRCDSWLSLINDIAHFTRVVTPVDVT